MTKKKNNSCFSKVLNVFFDKMSFDVTAFDDRTVDAIPPGTVRNWLTQKSFPTTKNYNMLRKKLETKMNDRGVFPVAVLSSELKAIMPRYSNDIDLIISQSKPTQAVLQLLDMAYAYEDEKDTIETKNLVSEFDGTRVQTKVVVFDFDGTLTKSNTVKTTWESIWEILGYDIQECKDLHKRFDRKEISHEEWCKMTEEKFKAKRLHKQQLLQIAEKIELIDDIKEVFQQLENDGIHICIVSGSIDYIIKKALGPLCNFIHDFKSNVFSFDRDGYLNRIIGTKYDFQGKATYITELCKDLRIDHRSVLFVGNSWNDEFVHLSGARTLCINPKQTSFHDVEKWHDAIEECKSLSEIYHFITL